MDHLLKAHAPIPHAGWEQIEEEAKQRLKTYLGARKLVEFDGPAGWARSAIDLGRVASVGGPCEGVSACTRRVKTLVEIRAEFRVSRRELEDAERGATDIELDDLDRAAEQIALAEDLAIFQGYDEGGIEGIIGLSPHPRIPLGPEAGTVWRSGRASTPASSRRPSTGATPCSTTSVRFSAAPSYGRRDSKVPSCSACAERATSSSTADRTYRSATSTMTRKASGSISRRASRSV